MKKSNVTLQPTKMFSDTQSVADFLGISRMQLYRWNKIIPLPKWRCSYGRRLRGIESWTEKQILEWKKAVALHHPCLIRYRWKDGDKLHTGVCNI